MKETNGSQQTAHTSQADGAEQGALDQSKDRREFLKMASGAAAAAVTMAAQGPLAAAQVAAKPAPAAEMADSQHAEVLVAERSGADFMVDVLKTLDFEFIAANPGSSFRGLQESFINYGSNKNPEWLTCCHEESSVAMAHGYYKIAGKPMMIMAHGTVGLQHASMAVYNAYADRVPVYMILGNSFDAATRRPGAEWYHSVQDCVAMVRDYTKWDDMPVSLVHFAESAVRAYRIAMTPPMGPVAIVADSDLQERPIDAALKIRIPKLTIPTPPQGDSAAVAEAAKLLVNAEYPVILADRVARTPRGAQLLVDLAETLQAAVLDAQGRVNFPSRHPLAGGNVRNADVILALEHSDIWGATNSMRDQLHRSASSNTKAGVKVITIAATDLYTKSNYQDFQRMREVDIAMAADAEATLPALIEAVKKLITADRRRFLDDRGKKIAESNNAARERAKQEAALAWDASPISTARLAAEIWQQIKGKDWSLVGGGGGWARRLWDFNKPYHHNGGSGAAGVGYSSPAAVGAALANKKFGRLSINVQNDGDLMYAPGVLWTAAHHRIPMLNIMNNNRAYHQEVMHLQRMANRYNRVITNAAIGNVITNPDIDYAKLAQSMGWYAEGPITNPRDIAPALKRAIAVVEKGEPALIDTVVQPR